MKIVLRIIFSSMLLNFSMAGHCQFDFNLIKGADPKAVYQKGAQLAEAAAVKYDALGCTASAAYCRGIVRWNNCMLSNLAGNACGFEPSLGAAPKCEAANMNNPGSSSTGGASGSFNQLQQKQQQLQQDLTNAQSASMSAYQAAISSGRKESGAILDATFAGASQISDKNAAMLYTGVGMGISLFTHLAEQKAEKREKAAAEARELDRKYLIIKTKANFLEEALNINKYNFSDLVSKPRYVAIMLVPDQYEDKEQNIYFSPALQVVKYADGTYPLKLDLEKKMLASVDKNVRQFMKPYTLYPITDPEQFTSDFIKKMGSGKVIYWNAAILNFLKDPFAESANINAAGDFWGNPVKDTTVHKTEIKKNTDNNFWNN